MPLLFSSQLHHLPKSLCLLLQARLASTTTQPYPYPRHPRPTPHQIFHLPHNASQQDIKSRYYELVRHHHPDSHHCRLQTISTSQRQANFQSIIAAYDVLRGKTHAASRDILSEQFAHRQRAWQGYTDRRRENERAYYRAHPGMDPAKEWDQGSVSYEMKDQMIILIASLTLVAGLFPVLVVLPWTMSVQGYQSALAGSNLRQAREDAAGELGDERMRAMKQRVKEYRMIQEVQDGQIRAAQEERRLRERES